MEKSLTGRILFIDDDKAGLNGASGGITTRSDEEERILFGGLKNILRVHSFKLASPSPLFA